MLNIRHHEDRGHASHGWLDSYHTFSFASYYDPHHMGFSVLRVINDDTVAPGQGFSSHNHRDMEILSYVLEGELEHKDSLGNGSVIRPGDIQLMSAGRGVTHSEYNHSGDNPVHFLQIWILPDELDLEPGYQQFHIPPEDKHNQWRLIASRGGGRNIAHLHQDVRIYAAMLDQDTPLDYAPAPKRKLWLHVASGAVLLNGNPLYAGDGVGILKEDAIMLTSEDQAEVLLFDLP